MKFELCLLSVLWMLFGVRRRSFWPRSAVVWETFGVSFVYVWRAFSGTLDAWKCTILHGLIPKMQNEPKLAQPHANLIAGLFLRHFNLTFEGNLIDEQLRP